MKRRIVIIGFAALLVAAGAIGTVFAGNDNFTAHLTGAGENPDVETLATGQAVLMVDNEGGRASWRLLVSNIEDVTQSHIHCGSPSVNGPVVVFLFGLDATPDDHNGVLSSGTFTDANVIDRPDSAACPGGISNFDDLMEKIASGEAYVNVHTSAHQGGEIRGPLR